MDYIYLIVKFVVGGGIVVGVTLLANYVNPKYGGVLAAAPIITTLAIVFTAYETPKGTTEKLLT